MRAIVIEPGRQPEVRDLAGDLESLQAAVGGYIEAFPLLPGVATYIDEEARIRPDTPAVNGCATWLCMVLGRPRPADEPILGPMVFIGVGPDGDSVDLPAIAVARVMDLYRHRSAAWSDCPSWSPASSSAQPATSAAAPPASPTAGSCRDT